MSKKKKIEEINLDGQILPYETEIEQVVLGSILLEGDIINKIIKDFTTSLFYNDKNKIVAESIISLYKENH